MLFFTRWHLITIGIIPPKRPFAYTQILSYIDGTQRLGATIKFGAFTDPFSHCTIGVAYQKISRSSNNGNEKEKQLQTSSSVDSTSSTQRGMFPSLIERAFLPQIVSQVWICSHFILLSAFNLLIVIFLNCRFQVIFLCHCEVHRQMIRM